MEDNKMSEELDETETETEEEAEIYTLTDEEGNEGQFELAAVKELDGNRYYALIPINGEDGDYYVVLKEEEEDGETILVTIDDDSEFDRVAAYFDNELFGEIDYDAEN